MASNRRKTIQEFYIEETLTFQKKYGSNTVIFMNVGSFYEMYGYKDSETGELYGSIIDEVCNSLDLSQCVKSRIGRTLCDEPEYIMAGFPNYKLLDMVTRVNECGYNVVIYKQREEDRRVIRELDYVSMATQYCTHTDPQRDYENDTSYN